MHEFNIDNSYTKPTTTPEEQELIVRPSPKPVRKAEFALRNILQDEQPDGHIKDVLEQMANQLAFLGRVYREQIKTPENLYEEYTRQVHIYVDHNLAVYAGEGGLSYLEYVNSFPNFAREPRPEEFNLLELRIPILVDPNPPIEELAFIANIVYIEKNNIINKTFEPKTPYYIWTHFGEKYRGSNQSAEEITKNLKSPEVPVTIREALAITIMYRGFFTGFFQDGNNVDVTGSYMGKDVINLSQQNGQNIILRTNGHINPTTGLLTKGELSINKPKTED